MLGSPVSEELVVLIGGALVGRLAQHEDGSLSFSYEDAYAGVPLSLSMPVSNATFGDKVVRPYLQGLLPEDRTLRRRLGAEFDVSGENPFALLKHMGYDCAGAVQVVPLGAPAAPSEMPSRYVAISEESIAARLKSIRDDASAVWQLPDEHWSLGGQQPKIALARFDGAWYECEGAAATTHIVKPGIVRLAHQALNEHLCLRLANLCGLPAVKSAIMDFDGVPAIVVARYDRVSVGSKQVVRLHQEDLCQALSVPPEKKYASEGGPSARDVAALFDRHPRARSNKEVFAAQLFFNYLVGAPDAHAKNYSVLLHDGTGPILSPLYDVASGLPYDHARYELRTAMSIGRENRVGMLRRSNIQRFSEAAGLDAGRMLDLLMNLADAILFALPELDREARSVPGGTELADRLMPELRSLSEKTLDVME